MLASLLPAEWVQLYEAAYAKMEGRDEGVVLPSFRFTLSWMQQRMPRKVEERRSAAVRRAFMAVQLAPAEEFLSGAVVSVVRHVLFWVFHKGPDLPLASARPDIPGQRVMGGRTEASGADLTLKGRGGFKRTPACGAMRWVQQVPTEIWMRFGWILRSC